MDPGGRRAHSDAMTAYAIAHLRSVDLNDEVADYLLRIDDTLVPFSGRFAVHGVDPEVLEGDFPGVIVIIEFPDLERAHGWYASPAYQAILPLRIDNSDGVALIVEGTPAGYLASSYLSATH